MPTVHRKVRLLLASALGGAGILAAGLFTYGVGHRNGRGTACFEVAVGLRDRDGGSLRTLMMSRQGAAWDYTFWGKQCTVTIHAPDGSGSIRGQWRFDLWSATLYANDSDTMRVYPAAGMWQPGRSE
jgi:hypothetical protein